MIAPDFRAVEPHLFYGLDLGQRRDHSALVILERLQESLNRRDPVTMLPRFNLRFILRHAERFPLHTPYLDIVRSLRELLRGHPAFAAGHHRNQHRTLVVDASGVGLPVVECLHAAGLKANILPIVIAAAGQPQANQVSRRDLVTNLRILLESGLLRIPPNLHAAAELDAELLTLSDRSSAARDDLAVALALAAWPAVQTLPTHLLRDHLILGDPS